MSESRLCVHCDERPLTECGLWCRRCLRRYQAEAILGERIQGRNVYAVAFGRSSKWKLKE